MGYNGIVNNFDEPNLIPSNIKNGVEVFGVEGEYEGGIGTANVGQSYYLSNSPTNTPLWVLLPAYVWEIPFSYINRTPGDFVVHSGNLVFVGLGYDTQAGGPIKGTTVLQIDLTTGQAINLGSITTYPTFDIRVDGDYLYINRGSDKYIIDMLVGGTMTLEVGVHTTGTIPIGNLTINSKIRTVSGVISTGFSTLRRNNSMQSALNWKGINISNT